MVSVVLAVAVWGPGWRSSTVQAFSDNMAVVCALSSGLARDPLLMHLLRCLHFFTAHFRIAIRARHIAGVHNTAADALSRDKSDVFFSCLLQAPPMPVRVPQALLDMLVHDQPDWTSSSWRSLFLSTLKISSPGHSTFIHLGTASVYGILCSSKPPAPPVGRTDSMYVCSSVGQGRTGPSNNQSILVSSTALRHYRRSQRSVQGRPIPSPAVCTQGHQAVT